jgi:hypothetical protein
LNFLDPEKRRLEFLGTFLQSPRRGHVEIREMRTVIVEIGGAQIEVTVVLVVKDKVEVDHGVLDPALLVQKVVVDHNRPCSLPIIATRCWPRWLRLNFPSPSNFFAVVSRQFEVRLLSKTLRLNLKVSQKLLVTPSW